MFARSWLSLLRRSTRTTRRARTLRLPAALLAGSLAVVLAGCGSSVATTSHVTFVPPSPTATPESSIVYVAMGASDAVGVGASDENTKGYVPILISRLPTGPRPPLNLGISGIKLHAALTQELPQAIADSPTLVTVWLSANDFRGCVPLSSYQADLNTLLDKLKAQTHAKVFVADLPDMAVLPAIQHRPVGSVPCLDGLSTAQIRAKVQQWNTVIDGAVASHGDVLVNLFDSQLTAHPNYISPADGFHPSDAGYAELANLFWQQMQAAHVVAGA